MMRRIGQILALLSALLVFTGGASLSIMGIQTDGVMAMKSGQDCDGCLPETLPSDGVCIDGCALTFAILPTPSPIAVATGIDEILAPRNPVRGRDSPPEPYPPRHRP